MMTRQKLNVPTYAVKLSVPSDTSKVKQIKEKKLHIDIYTNYTRITYTVFYNVLIM